MNGERTVEQRPERLHCNGSFVSFHTGIVLCDPETRRFIGYLTQQMVRSNLMIKDARYTDQFLLKSMEGQCTHYTGWVYTFYNFSHTIVEEALIPNGQHIDQAVEWLISNADSAHRS